MKILVVTFPNDLGSRTIETNLCAFLSPVSDMRHFRFAAQDSDRIDHKIDNRRNIWHRIKDMLKLRSAVRSAVLEGRKILFYNVSPALFAWGSWRGGEAYITMDWARLLLGNKKNIISSPITIIHKRIMRSCTGLLPMTTAMASCLVNQYGITAEKIHPVPSLFDVDHFEPGAIKTSDRIKVLYIGGDVKRKGGDLLYEAFRTILNDQCSLTMVTNAHFDPCDGFTLCKGIRYGTQEHLSIMRNHDIFILPTHEDAGPQVIGEAAASGMAVLTTRFALGAPHVIKNGVNGFISDTPSTCIEALRELLKNPEKIQHMRQESLAHMRHHYSLKAIQSAFIHALQK